MEEQASQVERVDPFEVFPAEIRDYVTSMAYLGYITKQITFCGHRFQLETLRPYVKFAISEVIEPYRNTLSEPEVFAAAHLGMALTSIDGRPDFCPPINDNLVDTVRGRMNWLTGPQGYWQPTIDYLFGELLAMEQIAAKAIAEFHRLSQQSRGAWPPSLDSLTDSGPSEEKTAGETQPSEPSS